MEQHLIRDFGIPQSAAAIIMAGFNDSLLRPVYTARERRVIALLKQNCISYPEIARRVGVTSERIRQIAEDEGIVAMARRTVCKIDRTIRADARLEALKARCDRYGLRLELLHNKGKETHNYYKTRDVKVNGRLCNLKAAIAPDDKHLRILPVRTCCKLPFDYVLYHYARRDIWVIVPSHKSPGRTGTMFVIDLVSIRDLTRTKRHDWRDYIEAWHLLK